MRYLKKVFSLSFVLGILFLSACNDNPESARLVIKLVDQPGNYKEVNVDIQGITVHTNGGAEESDAGWVELAGGNVGIKNLLDFTGGTELTLVDTDFPAGKISQIRLILGSENSVFIDKLYPLETPSAQQSGLKLQVHENLVEGITYEFKLDFDAANSVIHTGADSYILKPVIRVITETLGGAIKGIVLPEDQNVAITVLDGVQIIATTYAPVGSSAFILSGIDEGTYSLKIEPPTPVEGSTDPVYESLTLENVVVTTGQVTDVGTIQLLKVIEGE